METGIDLSNKTSIIGYTVISGKDIMVKYSDGRKVTLKANHYYTFSEEEYKTCMFYGKGGEIISITQNMIFI